MRRNSRDFAQKRYWEDGERIAELLNVALFDREKVVLADGIGIASKEVAAETGKNDERYTFARLTDVAKLVAIGENRLFLYIENQSYIDYAMAERNLALEAACYHEQYKWIRNRHREEKNWGEQTEFLAGFARNDRLLPALCIVLYYGDDEWDAEKSLHKLLDMDRDSKLKEFVNDSHVLVLDVKRMEGTEFLQTDLRETFTFIKYASDKAKLKKYIEENETEFRAIREDALEFMAYTTKTRSLLKRKEEIRTEKGEYDVCKAIQEMIEDGKKEGKIEGKKEGKIEGKKEGIKIGVQRGVRRGRRQEKHDMITNYIAVCRKDGNEPEQIREQLMKYFSLNTKQAEQYVAQSPGIQN